MREWPLAPHIDVLVAEGWVWLAVAAAPDTAEMAAAVAAAAAAVEASATGNDAGGLGSCSISVVGPRNRATLVQL